MFKIIAVAVTLFVATANCELRAQTLEEISKPSSLGDMALGSKTATVTVVEYASMTCPPCASSTETYCRN
jgi:protein-disulfide isomerase